jgi:hypothetical protein
MSDTSADEMAVTEAWIASKATEFTAAYLARGRKHQHLSDEELSSGWVLALRNVVDDIHDPEWRAAERDFESEFALRGEEPPYHLVPDELERLRLIALIVAKQLELDDPAKFAEMERQADAEFRDFLAAWSRPKN